MCGLMLAALLLNKEYDGPAALAFAAVVMLIGNPLVITSVGFQLSVASVAGIYLFCAGHPQVAGFSVPGRQREGRQTHVDSLVYCFRVHHPQRP